MSKPALTFMKPSQLSALALTLTFLLALIFWELWGLGGVVAETEQLHIVIAHKKQENARQRLRNEALANEVENLQQRGELMEEAARRQLGMIKQGEVFVQIMPNP